MATSVELKRIEEKLQLFEQLKNKLLGDDFKRKMKSVVSPSSKADQKQLEELYQKSVRPLSLMMIDGDEQKRRLVAYAQQLLAEYYLEKDQLVEAKKYNQFASQNKDPQALFMAALNGRKLNPEKSAEYFADLLRLSPSQDERTKKIMEKAVAFLHRHSRFLNEHQTLLNQPLQDAINKIKALPIPKKPGFFSQVRKKILPLKEGTEPSQKPKLK